MRRRWIHSGRTLRAGCRSLRRDEFAEFSDLEMDRYDDFNILSRSLTEISADVSEVLTQLEGFMGRVDSDIDEFTKLAHHLQDEITAARMVPIGNLYTRFSRTVRDAAKAAASRRAELEGAETELDNNIIQHISDPLIHLVRNAVAHGIEDSETRAARAKPEKGTHLGARLSPRQPHFHRSRRRWPRDRLREYSPEAWSSSRRGFAGGRRGTNRTRTARIAVPARIFDGVFDVGAGGPRSWTRRGARERPLAERRNRSALGDGPRRVLHGEGAAHADHFAGAVRSLRHVRCSRCRLRWSKKSGA